MPIFGGLPSLYLFCSDSSLDGELEFAKFDFPQVGKIEGLKIHRGKKWVNLVKLWQLAQVRQGIATADDQYFLRKTPGVVPNARRRYVQDVDLSLTIAPENISALSASEIENGIDVVDPQRTKHFVPYDSGGEANVAEGELRSFWAQVDYWIDWSKQSVDELKGRAAYAPGTPKKAVLRNKTHYFKNGIVGTITGLYAPTYRIGFGGVFGQKANLISPFEPNISEYLLVILSSKLMRYFSKVFISASVDFSTENFRHLPIAAPSEDDFKEAVNICNRAIAFRKREQSVSGDSEESITNLIDQFTYKVYSIPIEDQTEIENWFKRRYPHFGKAKQDDA
ncbi:MAG: hypothetical protein R2827_12725 [Bdellovibrionales bacterium]